GDEDTQRLLRDRIVLRQCRAGNVGGVGHGGRTPFGGSHRAVKVHEATPAQNLLSRNPALDALDIGEDLEVAGAARADVDMSALARNRDPDAARMNEPGNAKAGAGAEHDAACALFRLAA